MAVMKEILLNVIRILYYLQKLKWKLSCVLWSSSQKVENSVFSSLVDREAETDLTYRLSAISGCRVTDSQALTQDDRLTHRDIDTVDQMDVEPKHWLFNQIVSPSSG